MKKLKKVEKIGYQSNLNFESDAESGSGTKLKISSEIIHQAIHLKCIKFQDNNKKMFFKKGHALIEFGRILKKPNQITVT